MSEEKHRVRKNVGNFLGVIGGLAVFVCGFLFIAFYGRAESRTGTIDKPRGSATVTVDGTLETDEVDVSSKLPGRLLEMKVDDGDFVKAGQVVAVLEAEEIDAKKDQAQAGLNASEVQASQALIAVDLESKKANTQVQQAEAGLDASQAAYEMARQKLAALERGARPQEIAQVEQAVAAAQAQFDTASKTYNRVKNLANEGVLPQQKEDEIEMQYRSAEAQLSAAKSKLDLVKEGARKEEIQAAREQVRQAQAGIRASEQTLQLAKDAKMMVDIRRKDAEAAGQKVAASKGMLREVNVYKKQTEIVAPISGRVRQRISRAGEIVAPGYAILSITRTDKYWVDVYVDESNYAGRKLGETVKVDIPALGKTINGKITRVLPAADFATKRSTNENGSYDMRAVRVRIALSENPTDLAEGLTARVRF